MKKLLYLLLIFSSAAVYSQWVSTYTGNNTSDNLVTDSKGLAITLDNNGNCYVTGYTLNGSNGNDIIVIKYNSNGDTIWSRLYNSSSNPDDQGLGIAVDAAGNVFVTGMVSIINHSYDMILLKYNSSGVFQWARTYFGSKNNTDDRGLGIAVDAAQFIYITGYTTDKNGLRSMTTLKYDQSGGLVWSALEGGPDNLDSKGLGIVSDNAGNICVSGYAKTASGGNDMIIVKYKSTGIKSWSRLYNGSANDDDQALGIAVDAANNIYAAGYVTVNSNTHSTNSAVIKYSQTGVFQWIAPYNGPANGDDKAMDIATDADGTSYITGYTMTAASSFDYLTIKYSPAGVQQWVSTYNGSGNGDDKAYALGLVKNSNNVTTGVAITGASWGVHNNHDYATVVYSASSGAQLQVSRYSRNSNTDDIAKDLAVDNVHHRLFVTGYSALVINGPQEHSVITTLMIPIEIKDSKDSTDSKESSMLPVMPGKFSLSQNYPNPFNPSTNIEFEVGESSLVLLKIYDAAGKLLSIQINSFMSPGSYKININAENLSSGVYFYELNAGSFRALKKMLLIK